MHSFAFSAILAAALLSFPVCKGVAVEPAKGQQEAKTHAENAPSPGAAPGWKVRAFILAKDGAQVILDEVGTGKSTTLKSAARGGDRLLSASFTAESDELRVEALIDGVRHSIVQKAGDMERPSKGPSAEDRQKYESLSEKGRERFREELRSRFSDPKFRDAPMEERRGVIRSIFEKVSKEAEVRHSTDADKGASPPVPEKRLPPGEGGAPARAGRPQNEEHTKYESLSETGRERFRNAMREKFSDEAFRNAPEEERRKTLNAILEKIEKEDKEGR